MSALTSWASRSSTSDSTGARAGGPADADVVGVAAHEQRDLASGVDLFVADPLAWSLRRGCFGSGLARKETTHWRRECQVHAHPAR